jgi:hypothetical protein
MAIDPRIALGVNPPVIAPLQLRSPIEQLGKMLSLRNLMQENQAGELGLQQKQLAMQEAQKGIAQEQSLQDLFARNPTPGTAEVFGAGGTVRGGAVLKTLADQRKAETDRLTQVNTLNVANAKRRAQIASGVTDLETAKKAIWQTANEQAFHFDPVKNAQIARDTFQHLMDNGYIPEEWKAHAQESMDYAARTELADKLAEEARKEAKAPFELRTATAAATKAEQEAAGTQPITAQQKIANDLAEAATDRVTLQVGGKPHEVLVNKRTGVIVKDLGESGVKPPTFNVNAATGLLDRESARFAEPHKTSLKDTSSQLEKIADAKAMINSGAVGQALGIPKVLSSLVGGQGSGLRMTKAELDSIANARGIAGSAEGFINQISGEGKLTDDQKKKLTQLLDDVAVRIRQKQAIANDALDRINSAGSRDEMVAIDKEARKRLGDTGTGGGSQVPEAVKTVLKGAGPGIHTLSDGTKWMTAADGTITKQ